MATFFKKLFQKQVPETIEKEIAAVSVAPVEEKPQAPKPVKVEYSLDPPQLIVGSGQSIGQQRDHNEDAVFTLTSVLASDTRKIPFGLFIVADGMGGHQHGEVASALAIRAMSGYIVKELYLSLLSTNSKGPEQSLQEIMQEGILEANRSILKQVLGGGTTLTAALVLGDQMTIAHVGDSRAYLISSSGQIDVLTRDHSLVKRLVELGQLSPEEAAIHPQRNVLYRALGQGEPFNPDITTIPMPAGSYLLLCTDGLWGVVPQEELIDIVLSSNTPYIACQRLIEAANTGGGPDNISAVLIRLPD